MSSRSRVSSFMCMAFLYSSVKYQGTHGRCSCVFSLQGKSYNVTSMQSADDTARFTVEHNGYMFSYNPCRSFHFEPTPPPEGDCQDDMAMCYWVPDIMYHKIADQSTAKCVFNKKHNLPMLQYTGDSFIKKTAVLPKCDKSIKKPKFRVVDASKDAEFVFEVTHECACPDTCVISPSVHTTKDPAGTTVPADLQEKKTGVIKIVVWIFGSLGVLFIFIIVAIVIKRRVMRWRQNDEHQQPILGGVVDETRNNFEAGARGGSEAASESDSVRLSSSKKDDINRTLKNTSKTV